MIKERESHVVGHGNMWKIIAMSSFGTMLEYYDFFVYVALTSTLTELFLPKQDPVVASLLGVATFGIAYLARPLGTVIFSPMSDRIGRKKAFVITLSLMGASTVAIGCLPTYAAVGPIAPVALLFLRVLQGVAIGGEYGSAVVYVVEHAPSKKRGAFTSVLQGTAGLGLLAALLIVTALKWHLEPTHFTSWGWRVPFLISAPIVIIATWIRMGMEETPIFSEMKRTANLSKAPLSDTVGSAAGWKAILVAMFGAQGATSVTLYTSLIYMLYFLQSLLKVSSATANACLGVAIVIAVPFYPAFGWLSDHVGRARVMLIGTILWMLAAYPAFSGIRQGAMAQSWLTVTLLITLLAVLTAMVMAPLPSFIAECFPPQSRTTGFGLAQQFGNILFGGFLPLISLALVNWTGNVLAGVAYSIGSLLPCIAVTYFWGLKRDRTELKNRDRKLPLEDSLAPHDKPLRSTHT
jgi:MFS family permease